jgi:hypothetical protein
MRNLISLLSFTLATACVCCGPATSLPDIDAGPPCGSDVNARSFPCGTGGELCSVHQTQGCSSDADCTTIIITTDDCGALSVTGVGVGTASEFQAKVNVCNQGWDLNGNSCPAPTTADDGSVQVDPNVGATVSCVSERCTTSF